MSDTGQVEEAARSLHGSTAVEGLARVGLAGRGLVWTVMAVLAGTLLAGRDGGAPADQQGALRAIAERPLGGVLLAVVAAGFLGYALSLALSAAVGHREESGTRLVLERTGSGLKAVLYLALAAGTLREVLGSGSSNPASLTARVLQAPGGRLLVGLAGIAVLCLGGYLLARTWKRDHEDLISTYAVPQRWRAAVLRVGLVGQTGRALLVLLIGVFVGRAAVLADPQEAKGLDVALSTLAQQPFGQAMLAAAVLALLSYAAWSFVQAALHRAE